MYLKQGLKREEAIDFLARTAFLSKPGVSNLSTDVCAIPEFVTRPEIYGCFGWNWMAQGKLLGKRAMHKTVKQKYDIWLGEIKCNVKCLWQALLMLPIVISFVWIWTAIRVKIQFFSSVVLLCYFVVLLWCLVICFNILLFGYSDIMYSYALWSEKSYQVDHTFLRLCLSRFSL